MTRCPRCQRRFPPSGECAVHGRPTAIVEAQETAPHGNVNAPPGWKLAHHIASGGTAQVYSVERGGSSPPAILKWGRWRGRDIHARFALEAEILKTVGPPSTPSYIEHGAIDGYPYLIMEHVPGETLATWMSRNGARGGLGEILAILTRAAAALVKVHDAGFVHRDLKPENILIGPKGARILDFGLAKPLRSASPDLTQIGAVVGTVHYLSPEQIRTGGVVDQRGDIYSFGVIAYEMLAGQPPFVGERQAIEYQHQVVRPQSLAEVRTVPDELDALVLSCLAKQVESRPQTATDLQAALARVLNSLATIRGVGAKRPANPSEPIKPLGRQGQVALVWIDGADPLVVTRAITDVQGVIVRQRGEGILAAFTEYQHEAPLAVALGACRPLLEKRCRIVVHLAAALVRRSAQGKPTVYGPDVDRVETWLPAVPFSGLVLTRAAAEAGTAKPSTDVPGFFREQARDRTDATDAHAMPALVGRGPLVTNLVSASLSAPMLIGISGGDGTGKTRVLEAIVEKLQAYGRDVLYWRTRRRFEGDRADDDRLLEALGDPASVRERILVVDDADRLSSKLRATLIGELAFTRIVASPAPLFEVTNETEHQIAIELPPLSYADAGTLLREQLRPARLIPDVLVERLAIRGAGNPALLVALARDMKARGAIRRHAGGDEWYVAPDELDTLLAPPSPSWLARAAVDALPAEVAPLVRTCAGLGPRFCADEVAQIAGVHDAAERLAWLVKEGHFLERSGWFEFEDAGLQTAIYEHVLDERDLVHARAYAYWLSRKNANVVGWLARVAYHAPRAGEPGAAAACAIVLARQARRRGEHDHGELLLRRAVGTLAPNLADELRDALHELE